MKTTFPLRSFKSASARGFLEVDLAIALVILAVAILPLGFAFAHERKALQLDYCRAVANEIVDGEMEILVAGNWKNFPDGRQNYIVHSRAMANLPAGHFELTKTGNHLRLEWAPNTQKGLGGIAREITVP